MSSSLARGPTGKPNCTSDAALKTSKESDEAGDQVRRLGLHLAQPMLRPQIVAALRYGFLQFDIDECEDFGRLCAATDSRILPWLFLYGTCPLSEVKADVASTSQNVGLSSASTGLSARRFRPAVAAGALACSRWHIAGEIESAGSGRHRLKCYPTDYPERHFMV